MRGALLLAAVLAGCGVKAPPRPPEPDRPAPPAAAAPPQAPAPPPTGTGTKP